MYYVNIIQSISDGSFYMGFSEDPSGRLLHHNLGHSNYTRHKIPWKLVYLAYHHEKRTAVMRERKLKKCGRAAIASLIISASNKPDDYIGFSR